MSNLYVTEPPTQGKILLSTSHGDIEVELWARETPKACRNVIGLALEGYYDDMLWHRIVPGFCIQTGDPTGTGTGGESFYGEPFADEPNQRIKFNRRGLVAMANPGERDQNESQFFITLDSTPELQNKHTIFGRISNATIYNVLSLSEVELSTTEPDRPVFPPKLHTIRVLDNPFPDIVPRITREEKKEQEAAKRRARAEAAAGAKRREEKVKKNTGLLSFGLAEEGAGEEEEIDPRFKGGAKSSHDLLKNDKRLRKEAATAASGSKPSTRPEASTTSSATPDAAPHDPSQPKKRKKSHRDEEAAASIPIDLSLLRSGSDSSSTPHSAAAAQIEDLEASIRGLTKRSTNGTDEDGEKKKKKERKGKELLEEARRKYKEAAARGRSSSSGKRGADDREKETMDLLRKFQASSSGSSSKKASRSNGSAKREVSPRKEKIETNDGEDEMEAGMREYGASDDEDTAAPGQSWRSHIFDYGGKSVNESKYTMDNYVTLDPRDTSGSAAARMGFGGGEAQKREREERIRKEGRKGRDWVDERSGGGRDGRGGGDWSRKRGDEGRRERNVRERQQDAPRPRDIERW
ncbi:cyclophilin-like protein [Jaminaea rosea]|uniref:Cyclophilin-like protein n=1 Tax=Jaminaea rosea TaxID=1569628 RepID=A0A316UYD3_9BASI|nr:cyclophilin-like protein [Jaminaea rosea]PWN30310.1 cyclophilin-like protein [Jaminaea rosea]